MDAHQSLYPCSSMGAVGRVGTSSVPDTERSEERTLTTADVTNIFEAPCLPQQGETSIWFASRARAACDCREF